VPLRRQEAAERIDCRRFADAGNAGDADADGATGLRQQMLDQCLRLFAMVGATRFRQRDGARQRGPLAGEQGLGKDSDGSGEVGHDPT
jgi:hypothetical protein